MSKYKAVKTNGYASKAEARRAGELKLLEKAGKISCLREQSHWVLLPAAPELGYKRPLEYVDDFQYFDNERMMEVIEDCKGFPSPVYLLKKRLMRQLRGITITEVR